MLPNASDTLDSLEADNWRLLYECRWSPERRAEVVPALIGLIEDDNLSTCQRAMRAAARIGACDTRGALNEFVAPVAKLLEHDDELARQVAAGTLCAIGADNPAIAVPALVHAARREELLVPAMQALIEMGDLAKGAASLFVAKANHRHAKVRRLAVRGLIAIGVPESVAIPVLQSALKDRNSAVRGAAAKAIGAKRPEQVIHRPPTP